MQHEENPAVQHKGSPPVQHHQAGITRRARLVMGPMGTAFPMPSCVPCLQA